MTHVPSRSGPEPSPTRLADFPRAVAPACTALLVLAVALPTLLAVNWPPSATFLNQAAALIGWSLVLLLIAPALDTRRRLPDTGALALVGALAVSAVAAAASMVWAGLPTALGVSDVAVIAAAALVAACGVALPEEPARAAFRAFAVALLTAGALSVIVGGVQVFAPEMADGTFVAAPAFEGRASGNMRQPNHLSTLLLWAIVAAAWLHEAGLLGRAGALVAVLALDFTLVLTASRTGIVGTVILAAWGLLDRRLRRSTRLMLVAMALVYWVFWLALSAWAHGHQQVFAGEARITAEGDISSSRYAIWSDTVRLIASHPWWGVGFGEFNFAWSLTPFPKRPVAFFDHTHNLPLQLLVEMGIPVGGLVFALLVYALWRAFAASRDATPAATTGPAAGTLRARTAAWLDSRGPAAPRATMLRAAFVLVLIAGLHSLLEYPLWYAYFLLPTAFAFGLCFSGRRLPRSAGAAPRRRHPRLRRAARVAPAAAAAVMLALSVAAVVDYRRVVVIFTSDDPQPLDQRILAGERSWFFAHHAHYAAATIAEHPSDEMASFRVATHYLLDTRLMMAWANAYAEAGDLDRARHLAARLREFRNEDAKPYFAPCDAPAEPSAPRPYQCTPPTRALDYRDFR